MVAGYFMPGEGEKFEYDDLQRRKRLAEALIQQGSDYSPVQSWTQGAARIAQALSGSLQREYANKLGKQGAADYEKKMSPIYAALTGGGSPSPAMPSAPSAPGPAPSGGSPRAASFSGSQEEFVQAMMPHAMKVSQETGVDPRVIIAQAALESGWGKSAPGNNFFGIKSHGREGGQNLATTENINGQNVSVRDSFRAYGDMGESANDYAAFLKSNPRYRPMLQAQGMDAQIEALAKSGYATDPMYGNKIGQIARGIPMPGQAPQPTQVAQAGMTPDGMPTSPVASDAPPMAYAPGQQAIAQAAPQAATRGQQLAQAVGAPAMPQPQPTGNIQAAMMQILSDPRFSPQQKAQAMQMYQMGQNQNKATYQTDGDGNIIQLDPSGRQAPRVVYKAAVKPMTVARGGAIYNPQTGQFVTPPAGPGQQAEVGLNPQYGVDAEGNPVLIQLGKDGRAVQSKLPEGVKLSKEPIRVDAGTEIILLDPITRNPVGRIPKNIAEAARQREVGEAQGQSQAAAPSQLAAADDALSVLNQIKTHKGMDRAIGVMSNFPTVRGSEAYGFESLVDQARSGAFLTAIGQLKGMGALSNAEGQTATAAVTRMNIGQSKADFMKALEDYEKVVRAGREKALRTMQGGSAAPATPATDANDGWQEIEGVRVRRVN